MPHITIEHSVNLADAHDVDALVADVHAVAAIHPWVPIDGLRTRAVARHHYLVADGAPANAFVALTVRVGPGRTDDEKQASSTRSWTGRSPRWRAPTDRPPVWPSRGASRSRRSTPAGG